MGYTPAKNKRLFKAAFHSGIGKDDNRIEWWIVYKTILYRLQISTEVLERCKTKGIEKLTGASCKRVNCPI